MRMRMAGAVAIAALFGLASGVAAAQDKPVKIGALYPLSGQVAKSGEDTLNAIKLAVEVVNGAHPDSGLPFAKTGLANLKGAKLELIAADHQGSPEIGAAEAERLIAQQKVVALIGAFHSSVAATSSQVAERNQIPYVSGESEATTLTERGFKYFFRTTPSSRTQAQDFFTFLRSLNQANPQTPVKTVALVAENTLWGQEFSKSAEDYFKSFPEFALAAKVSYAQGTTDVSSEVQRLIAAKPDVVMHASYDAEAILFTRTYKSLGFQPQGVMAIGAAFGSSAFRTALGEDSNNVLVREHWSRDLAGRNALIEAVGKLYQAKYGKAMDGTPARAFQATMVLADAINRAGAADPDKIRDALAATNLPADQLVMPWEGVKFDASGQNTLTRGIFIQTQAGAPATVWPFDAAQAKLVWPRPAWK